MTGEGTRDKGLPDNDPALESTDLLLKGSIGTPLPHLLSVFLSIETDDLVAI
jgi:hypothetical protein